MKRILHFTASVCLVGGSFLASGCMTTARDRIDNRSGAQAHYDEYRDPCWPERYNYEARKPVVAVFAQQVNNGQILDHTIVNGDFEPGTDKLTAGGQQRLSTLARSRPASPNFYVAKSRDIAYDPAKPSDYVKQSSELDAKRVEAVSNYLNATNQGRNLAYLVTIIDPQDQLYPSAGPAAAFRGYPGQFQAGINVSGQGAVGVGGANATANVNANVPQAGTGGNQPQPR